MDVVLRCRAQAGSTPVGEPNVFDVPFTCDTLDDAKKEAERLVNQGVWNLNKRLKIWTFYTGGNALLAVDIITAKGT